VFPLNLYARVRTLHTIAHGTAGAACTRSSLRPLFEGGTNHQARARVAPRECGLASACCL